MSELQFFNYHEFIHDSLVINHFPNHYVGRDTALFETTRIVRIPRVYDNNVLADIIPQFSPCIPGHEEAGLKKPGLNQFEPEGQYENQNFGVTSLTPLVPTLLSPPVFVDIINQVNSFLLQAYNPWDKWNIIDNFLDFLSGGIYSDWFTPFSKRKLAELDKYIDQTNIKLNNVKIISPRLSGYLSLDFQIPKP